MSGRGRGRGRGRRNGPTMQQFNSLKHAMTGQKLKMAGQDHPPAISSRPFNSLCLRLFVQPADTFKVIGMSTVAETLVAQTGIGSTSLPRLNIKFRSVKAWATASIAETDPPFLRLNVTSLSGATPPSATGATNLHPYQVVMQDTGSLNESARCGYIYPAAQQKIPIPADADFAIVAVQANTSQVVLHVDLSWSLTDVAPVPTTSD